MHIGIYIYDEVEVLDFTGPFEVFTTAARIAMRANPVSGASFRVFLVAERLEMVRARGNLLVQPHHSIRTHPAIDTLIVPGGEHAPELDKTDVISWLVEKAPQCDLIASVCTGAFLLAKAGLLAGRPCTTHWEDLDDLRSSFPGLDVREGVPWVDDGDIITSAGISAGIEMALHMVARLAGEGLALRTARQMQYDWRSAGLSKEAA